jgi:hypothetical protein
VGQVAPIEIFFFDQLDFPIAPPVLRVFLARDRLAGGCELLDANEAVQGIFLDEFRATEAAVLIKPGP